MSSFGCASILRKRRTLLLLAMLLTSPLCSNGQEFCSIGDDDTGDFNVFVPGEAVPVPNVCGFSTCHCDPDLEKQLLCTFCYDHRRDECMVNGQTKEFDDAICSCEASSVNFVCEDKTDDSTSDMPTQKPQPQPQTPCVFQEQDGSTVLLDTSDVQGPCSGDGFPYICNEERNLLLYPYCEHKTSTGSTICAKEGEFVVFLNENFQNTRCDCSVDPDNLQPISNCQPEEDQTAPPTETPDNSNWRQPRSEATTIRRESIGSISGVATLFFLLMFVSSLST
eukprot:scaffold2156_cov115-Cylindrotheca_fusiformis.AAC.24